MAAVKWWRLVLLSRLWATRDEATVGVCITPLSAHPEHNSTVSCDGLECRGPGVQRIMLLRHAVRLLFCLAQLPCPRSRTGSRFFYKDDAGSCDSRSRLLFLKRLGTHQLKYKPHNCLSKIMEPAMIVSLPACAAISTRPLSETPKNTRKTTRC